MLSGRARHFVPGTFLLLGLAACDLDNRETVFQEGPKGFVEFYIPESSQGEASVNVDAQIYRTEHGQRIFMGMTRKWNGLAEQKRGLTVAVAPGKQEFVIVHGDARTGAEVVVKEGGYHRVRIGFTGISQRQMIGTTYQVQFRMQASVEPQQEN
jgi:hypothetical protein